MDHRILRGTKLFAGLEEEEIRKLTDCLGCYHRRCEAGQRIWMMGDRVSAAGIVLQGAVVAETLAADGRRALAARHEAGSIFGDILMTEGGVSPVDIVAAEKDTELLFVPFERLMSGCGKGCSCHDRLRLNLLQEIADKYWQLRRHIRCLRTPGLRDRLLVYLGQCAAQAGRDTFRVPLDRQAMADHLAVNRSAMCRELSRMKAEGLVDYYKQSFRLLKKE